jgi:HAE1 family hydrophobic/amphiphilic exporter-1
MKIIEISTRRKVTIAMFTIGILLFGFVSLTRLKINLLPELSYPTLTIRTEFEGAAPAEVENLVTKPVEEALGVVKNVQQVRSISRSGQSDVTLEFAWGTNMDYASLDVREKLDAIQLPLEVQRPVILRFDPTLDPIMRFALYKETGSPEGAYTNVKYDETDQKTDIKPVETLKLLRRFGDEQLKKELEAATGVASVKVSGGLEEEIQVLVDEKRLAYLNIPIDKVVDVLSAENVNLSGGRLEQGTQQYLVRTLNQFQTVDEIQDIVVDQNQANPVYIRDIADVHEGYKEREAITRLNGREAVEIAIYKEGDANTVAVANEVKKQLKHIRKNLPAGVKLVKVYDQSTFINQAVDEVVNAGIIGGILAVVILFLFLRDIWATFIISLSIPVSVIATFNLMYGYDISLNIMSLGGIALGIGLLVDNSIVVLENISRHRDMGKSTLDAAREGASEVGMAVMASTLTTVAVFFPLVFVKGIAGQLFRDQALTVTFSLLASLLVAITLIPMLSSLYGQKATPVPKAVRRKPETRVGQRLQSFRLFIFVTVPIFAVRLFLKGIKGFGRGILFLIQPLLKAFEKSYQAISDRYPNVIRWALVHKSMVLLTALAIFVLSLMMIPRLGVELIPSLSQGEFRVEFRMPPGTPLQQTDAAIQSVQLAATTIRKVNTTFAVAGTGNRMDANPEEGGENWGELNVNLISGSNRSDEESTMEGMRTELQSIPGLQYKFSRPALFTFKTPVEIEVSGYDLNDLKHVSDVLSHKLQASSRFTDVKSTMERGHPEIQIHFDREKAAALGLAVHNIADRIVSKIKGDVATRYSLHDRKIDILVRARSQDRASVDEIRRLIVNPESDKPIPLEAIAKVQTTIGPGEIRRIAQQRVAVVTANLSYGDLGAAAGEINKMVNSMTLPAGIFTTLGGQNEEMSASFRSLLFALALAMFLVYLVMASQFESLIHPLVILFTIPLALVGAIWALWLTNSTISVVVFIGLILLVGIVVNNAIVLIDLINQLRQSGMEKYEAIVEGGRLRLRPILMTTLTTALGLLPMSLAFGEGAEIRAPMGITVIGGLTISTLLTLVVIPVMYAILDRKTYASGASADAISPDSNEQ